MWEGMASYGGWFMLQMASHTKPFSPSMSQQSAVAVGNRTIDSRASQRRKEPAADRTAGAGPPVASRLCRPRRVLWAIGGAGAVSIGESRAEVRAI